MEPQEHTPKDAQSFTISKKMIALLRHGTLPRDVHGAMDFWRLKKENKSGFPNSTHWSIQLWIDHLKTGGGHKKRFQFCTNSNRTPILYLRAIQGHSGENPVDPSLLYKVLIAKNFEFIDHVGSCFNLHSFVQGKTYGRDRQTVFLTAVDPMDQNWVEQEGIDLTKPRRAAYKQNWKISQGAVYRVDIGRAQHVALRFFQTLSNAIILFNTLPSICVCRLVSRKTEEILCTRTNSPRPAPTITLKSNWRKDWDSKAATSSNGQPNQPSRLAHTVTPVVLTSRAELDPQNFEQVQKDNEEFGHVGSVRPKLLVNGSLDLRIQGLSHSEVEESEHGRVRALINQMESHPHQEDVRADLRQNNVYNPFSEDSKKMFREMGNVEYSELCETDLQVQCSYCLSYWAKGIENSICGVCLCHTEEMRRMNTKRFDTMSISNYVIKRGAGHGAQHGKSKEQVFYHQSFNAWKRCRKKKDASGEHFAGILDRFRRDPPYRESQEKIGWTEAQMRRNRRKSAGKPRAYTDESRMFAIQIKLEYVNE